MRKYEGNLVGVLGTVIIHLIAAIIFMSFQLRSIQRDLSHEFEVEFVSVEENDNNEDMIELPVQSIEKILDGDEEMLNIARNLANKPDIDINPEDYIDQVKEELIESGQLEQKNYEDEQMDMQGDENMAYDNNEDNEANTANESQEMAANYKGPTRIYYDLKGRTHTYLPIPIYKCEGSGIVVLAIEVNRKGDVEKARIIANRSTTSDPCLTETAVSTAMISRFNSDINSPKIQTGTLSYHFVAQ
jgi:hypothetical protein